MMWRRCVVFVAVVACFSLRSATAGFEDRVFNDADGEHRYSVFLPKDYSPDQKWPVILFLHGAGERGTDGKRQLTLGLGPVVKHQADTFPAIAVFPQCEDLQGRYLTGWLAGSGTYERQEEAVRFHCFSWVTVQDGKASYARDQLFEATFDGARLAFGSGHTFQLK